MNPLRITFLLARDDLSGGVRVVSIYADALRRRGHDVLIVTRPPRRPTMRERARSIVRGVPLPSAARSDSSHLHGLDVRCHRIDRHRPITGDDVPDADIVVATWWETAQWAAALPTSKGVPCYFIQHYEAHDHLPADQIDATWRLPMHKIVIAGWLRDMARDHFGDPQVSLVPNAVDLDQFNAPPRGKQSHPTVGMVYSPVSFKGCDIALRAFELARERVANLRLIAFGSSRPTLDLPLPEGAEFIHCPPQDSLRSLYSRCDGWLFASRSEGFGLPLLEAMACRTPVIATPAGAAPELITPDRGFLVPHENPQAMAAAIESLCALSEADWRTKSDNVFRAAGRYTWQDATDGFEAALARAIAEANHGRFPSLARAAA